MNTALRLHGPILLVLIALTNTLFAGAYYPRYSDLYQEGSRFYWDADINSALGTVGLGWYNDFLDVGVAVGVGSWGAPSYQFRAKAYGTAGHFTLISKSSFTDSYGQTMVMMDASHERSYDLIVEVQVLRSFGGLFLGIGGDYEQRYNNVSSSFSADDSPEIAAIASPYISLGRKWTKNVLGADLVFNGFKYRGLNDVEKGWSIRITDNIRWRQNVIVGAITVAPVRFIASVSEGGAVPTYPVPTGVGVRMIHDF